MKRMFTGILALAALGIGGLLASLAARYPLGLMLWASAAGLILAGGLLVARLPRPAHGLSTAGWHRAGWLTSGALIVAAVGHFLLSISVADRIRPGVSGPGPANAALEISARLGNAEDAQALGLRLAGGIEGPADPSAAILWLKQAAAAGVQENRSLLGQLLLEQGNRPEAAFWLQEAAMAGDTQAMLLLAAGGPSGDLPGLADGAWQRWLQRAADAGHARAMGMLGSRLMEGNGFARDETAARHWLQRASGAGDSHAAYNLGLAYHYGRGGPVDIARAISAYRRAAANGSVEARLNLGALLMGDPSGQAEARHLMEQVAAGPNRELAAIARENLAELDWRQRP
jgi:TPR repeat protein